MLDYRSPRPGAGSLHEHPNSTNTFSQRTDKALFGLVAVCRKQERQQVEGCHFFSEDPV
jgi:hypothetical protein